MRHFVLFLLLSLAPFTEALAQELDFPEKASGDDAVLAQAMPELAKKVLAGYHEAERETYLDNLFRLQMVAGQYGDAIKTITERRALRAGKIPGGGDWIDVQYEVLAKAKAGGSRPFEDAYKEAFQDVIGQLDDRNAALVIRTMRAAAQGPMKGAVQREREKQKGKERIALADALQLVRDYQVLDSYRTFTPLALPLADADDNRRYVIVKDQLVRTGDGASICTTIVRPRVEGKLPAALEFTIYVDPVWNLEDPLFAAAHGYIGVIGLTRGKGCGSGPIVPYVHDGPDAAALIDWIGAQPWSDGRVGMYSGSYNGFTAWSAAKQMPKALKAIAVGAPARPGVDVPMEGNVFWNFVYAWPFFTTDLKGPDDATYNDFERWNRLNRNWYVSGRAYRDLDKIDGKPNPIFDEWIAHPSYDAYWQQMLPSSRELAQMKVAVLQTAGYYFGGPGAAVPYYTAYEQANPKAEQYLLIGPYHHFGAQIGVVGLLGQIFPSLAGLDLDPAALINIEELRYQFFDYVFKGAPRPELLKDRVNYEVTGANVWKHAPSLETMANERMRLHLTPARSGANYSLSAEGNDSSVTLKVNMTDRSDADRQAPGGGVVSKEIDTWNGLEFISDPLPAATELSGLFSGRLDFLANKKDFDFEIDLYELTPKGDYVLLAPYWTRASYAGHPSRRQLLTPGKRHRLDFRSIRLMSRALQQGSRLVLVLTVIKGNDRQINYGSGKDVSAETIKDAGAPLVLKWYGDSYVELPVWRAGGGER